MNPNHLSRDELLYELRLRGVNSEGDVASLRKLFRSVVTRGLPVDSCLLKEVDVEELYAVASGKILELQELVKRPEITLPSVIPRARTKLVHLQGRVEHLQATGQTGPSVGSESIRRLVAQLEAVTKIMATLEESDSIGGKRDEESSGETVSNIPSGEEQTPGIVREVSPETSTSSIRGPVVDSRMYQKWPHPFTTLLKELPLVDGSNVELLCDFLLKAVHLQQDGQIRVPNIYELLYPYCKGEVLLLLRQALAASESFPVFHARVLNRCVPRRQLGQLRFEQYERAQAEGESLAKYCQAVRDAASIFQISEPESQVVRRIVEGLTPTQRARLVFQSPPSTWQELEELITIDRNIAYHDQTRQVRVATVPGEVRERVCSASTSGQARAQRARQGPGNSVVCFRCGRAGHVQRDCFGGPVHRTRQGRWSRTHP